MTNPNSNNVLDKIFSGDFFKSIDTAALALKFDISSALRDGNLAASPVVAPIPQTDTNIASIPPEGIIIDTPGQYQFLNDITWSPAGQGSAITIQADNVGLNLNGFMLSVAVPDPNTDQQYNGISVVSAVAVIVENGTVTGASYYGVNASKAIDLQINNMIIGDISYYETAKADVTPCGIFIDSTDGFSVQNCTVQNISVTAPSCAGIQIVDSANGNVSGCTMYNFLNNDGGVQGFSYLTSSQILTSSCASEQFQSHYLGLTDTTGHTVIGYVPIFCDELEFNYCSASNMTGCCDDCHGMSVFLDSNVEVNNFSAKNVIDGVCPANTGAKATGLEVYGDNITINNCTVENITAIVPQDLQSAGFSAWGNSITFNNCTATNVVVTDAYQNPSTDYGYGTGFGWAPDPRSEFNAQAANRVQYNNCNSNSCQLGFDTWFHTNSIWNDVMSYDCPIFILAEPDTATRTLSMDRCSESPNGQFQQVTITNIAANNTYPEIHYDQEQNESEG